MAGANGEDSILQAARAKGPPSANLAQIFKIASPTLFWVDLTRPICVVNAKFGSVLKENVGNDIITQLESIAI